MGGRGDIGVGVPGRGAEGVSGARGVGVLHEGRGVGIPLLSSLHLQMILYNAKLPVNTGD